MALHSRSIPCTCLGQAGDPRQLADYEVSRGGLRHVPLYLQVKHSYEKGVSCHFAIVSRWGGEARGPLMSVKAQQLIFFDHLI
jgi:hypothetical protein